MSRDRDPKPPRAAEPSAKPAHPPGTTPVMAQFLDMKAEHPGCLLFFRMGDFYEMFFEDAVIAADALGITLTKRGKSGGEEIPMCGVPHHQADRYLHDLIRKGFRVAVAEQMEDPAEAKKRGYKAVVRRDVTRVVTSGTLTEDGLLERRRHNYLAAYAERGRGAAATAALAWVDISTGDFRVSALAPEALAAELERLSPAEIVAKAPVEDAMRLTFEEAGAVVAEQPGRSFDPARAEKRVAAALGAATLEAYGAFEPAECAAMGALIDYLELTQRGRLPLLKPPQREEAASAMRIDAATRRNLELTQGPGGGRDGSLLATIDLTVTSAGARLLAERLSGPLARAPQIRARHDEVDFLLADRAMRGRLRQILRETPDIERALSRLGLGRGGPRDLAALRDGLSAAAAARAAILAGKGLDGPPPGMAAAAAALDGFGDFAALLTRALAEDPPLRLSDGGAIAEGVEPALDEARALRDGGRQVVAGLQERYQTLSEIAALKVKHNNVLGYFIETPAGHAKRMMTPPLSETFSHRQTTANAVRFTTVELAELEGKIARAAEQAAALEKAAFDGLTEGALARAGAIRDAAAALAMLDVSAALAELAETARWTRPMIREDRAFRLREARHPVVEAALIRASESFAPNDCDLSADPAEDPSEDAPPPKPIWLLTGPNMAGKSTFLRQNALIAVLAQMGAFVPAASAEIGVVDQLFSRVGASDDLARGRSTFMVEMVETAAILNQAGPWALVILDEIGRGTATYDGLSIAWATLEHLHGVNTCRALFATHYHELTALGAALPGLKNATMAVKEWKGEVVFLRQVVGGAADRSYGVQVARLAGMPKAVVARAKTLLETLEQSGESAKARAEMLVDDLPLFAATAEAGPDRAEVSPVEDHLQTLDPDAMTPREAHAALYELKALMGSTS